MYLQDFAHLKKSILAVFVMRNVKVELDEWNRRARVGIAASLAARKMMQ